MKIIKCSKGKDILVSDEDYNYLSKFSWNTYCGYARRFTRKGKGPLLSICMHQEIIKTNKNVDHINRNKLDNTRQNLREATNRQNGRNQAKQSRKCYSKYKGVTYHKRDKKWQTQIRVEGARLFLGYFETERDAALAYNNKALEIDPEFFVLNIID